jgi:hypothetical protein
VRSTLTAAIAGCLLLGVPISAAADSAVEEPVEIEVPSYFTLDNGLDLRSIGDESVRRHLTRVRGRGARFGSQQKNRYCRLKQHPDGVQWVLSDLDTGTLLSRSPGADRIFFGASTSKLFVAAALLDKQEGDFSESQLGLLVRMIVVSDNGAWLALQRQVGDDGTSDSGRAAVQQFVRGMGYPTIRGFQGWMRRPDGSRVHGNELNSIELSRFLYDTYQRNYDGADVLWKIMQATKTGASKIDKYTPAGIYIGGKTGTYSGPNESPETVELPTIKARNHAAVLSMGDRHYGIAILANTGDSEDVAVLGGGLMREHLGVEPSLSCP